MCALFLHVICVFFFLIPLPPRSSRTYPLFPYTTLFRSGLTLALAAVWVGPFLFNLQFMTDMKYAPYPEDAPAAWGSYWEMLFDQKPAIDRKSTRLNSSH